MELSKYIIVQELNENAEAMLLYQTRTTALVLLNKEQYNGIFIKRDFSDEGLVSQLSDMGFIVDSHNEELNVIIDTRRKFMEIGHQHLTILTTTKCNAKCFYCFENGIEHYDMSLETADATISFIKNNFREKVLSILWLGGEPLVNFDIIRYITMKLVAAGYEIITSVTTNGALLTKDMVDFFKKYSIRTTLQFSLDAAINEEYYKIKRYEGLDEHNAFNHVIDNIKLSIDSDLYTDIRFNFVSSKIQKAKEVFKHVKSLLDNHDLSKTYIFLAPLDLNGGNEIISDFHGNIEHPYLQVVRTQQEMGFPIRAELQQDSNDILASFALMPTCYVCGMTTKMKIVVDADGTLYKCHRFVGRKKFSCGDVTIGIDETSPSYLQFREVNITDEECRNCSILPICQSGCIAKREMLGNSQKCHKIKQVQKQLVKMYYEAVTQK